LDILILTVCYILAYTMTFTDIYLSLDEDMYFYISHFSLYIAFLVIYTFSFVGNNLYKRNIISTRYRHIIIICKSIIIAIAFSVIIMIVSNTNYFLLYGKTLVLYFFLLTVSIFVCLRALVASNIFLYLIRKRIYSPRVVIVGNTCSAHNVADRLTKSGDFFIVGCIDDNEKNNVHANNIYKNLGVMCNIKEITYKLSIDEIIIAIDNVKYDRLISIVEKCLETGKVVRIYSNLLGVIADKINVEFYGTIPVVMLSQYSLFDPAWMVKRILDIIVCSLALVFLCPIFFIISIAIKLSSKGPIIYRQVRIGKNGKPFNFYKFRSMHMNSDNSRHREFVRNLIENGDPCRGQEIRVFKLTDDPRIFTFGKFIRKTSLDEFPQLINVLKGEMTLVGPRPCLPYEWECYSEWHKKRLTVPPGCTGLWQAVGRSTVTFEDMVVLDLYYISNMTSWFDLKIILQTFPVIFLAKGAH
jgi:exopolysaccharide biosynthesis polyprenyl glycosylphosphotransferase